MLFNLAFLMKCIYMKIFINFSSGKRSGPWAHVNSISVHKTQGVGYRVILHKIYICFTLGQHSNEHCCALAQHGTSMFCISYVRPMSEITLGQHRRTMLGQRFLAIWNLHFFYKYISPDLPHARKRSGSDPRSGQT